MGRRGQPLDEMLTITADDVLGHKPS